MNQTELLAFYRAELRRSKRWRSDNYDPTWHRLIDLYRGKQYAQANRNDQLIVNLAFATKNVIAPSVAINNPRFTVTARSPEDADRSVVVEEVLNYFWRCHKYQDEIRLAVDDWINCGHGWVKVGYKTVKPPESKDAGESGVENMQQTGDTEGIDDREPIVGNAENESTIVDTSRPTLDRVSLFDMFVDPDARAPRVMRWIAQRTWRAVQDVRVDSRYDPKVRRRASESSQWRTTNDDGDNDGRPSNDLPDQGAIGYCEVIEFYDLKRNTVCTFDLDGDDNQGNDTRSQGGFLIKPDLIPYGSGQPFRMLRGYEVTDTFYPIGDIEQIESLQLELNETRNQMMNHRKRFSRKWIYARDMFDQDGVAALSSDVDNTMIPIAGDVDPSKYIAPLPSVGTPPDFYNQSGLIEEDINTVSGVSDYMRGQPESSIRRTATEAAMIQDAANSRARDKLAKVESFLADCGEAVMAMMQQFVSGEQVARVTSVSVQAWVNFDADYLKGSYDFEVEGGSTEPRNEAFRRQSALQLVDAMAPFVEIGVVDPSVLARYVLQYGFGVKDPSKFLMAPPQQAAMQQQGQVPPGAAGPGGGAGPMPEEMPPGGAAVPPGGEQLPPELMAAMAGQAGGGAPGGAQLPPELLAMLGGGAPPAAGPAGAQPQIPPELLAQMTGMPL
jgi:hypothetical protein